MTTEELQSVAYIIRVIKWRETVSVHALESTRESLLNQLGFFENTMPQVKYSSFFVFQPVLCYSLAEESESEPEDRLIRWFWPLASSVLQSILLQR